MGLLEMGVALQVISSQGVPETDPHFTVKAKCPHCKRAITLKREDDGKPNSGVSFTRLPAGRGLAVHPATVVCMNTGDAGGYCRFGADDVTLRFN